MPLGRDPQPASSLPRTEHVGSETTMGRLKVTGNAVCPAFDLRAGMAGSSPEINIHLSKRPVSLLSDSRLLDAVRMGPGWGRGWGSWSQKALV